MAMNAANPQVATPRIQVITANTAAALQAAVDVKTNALNKTINAPGKGQTIGPVVAGTIKVSEPRLSVDGNNTTTYYASVMWTEFVTPS